jgi:hypothetical protein
MWKVGVDYQCVAITFLEKSSPICVFFLLSSFVLKQKNQKFKALKKKLKTCRCDLKFLKLSLKANPNDIRPSVLRITMNCIARSQFLNGQPSGFLHSFS